MNYKAIIQFKSKYEKKPFLESIQNEKIFATKSAALQFAKKEIKKEKFGLPYSRFLIFKPSAKKIKI